MTEEVFLDRKKIGKRIQNRRKQLKMKQEELAEKVGSSRTHISSIERGNEGFSVEMLVSLCDVLDLSTDYILCGASFGNNVAKDVYNSLKLLSSDDLQMMQNNIEFLIEKNSKSQLEKKAAGRAGSYKP